VQKLLRIEVDKYMAVERDVFLYSHYSAGRTIIISPDVGGQYKVLVDKENLGSFKNIEAAMQAIAEGELSLPDGLKIGELDIPLDLSLWTKKLFAHISRLRPPA
jgi:hypothetical protein